MQQHFQDIFSRFSVFFSITIQACRGIGHYNVAVELSQPGDLHLAEVGDGGDGSSSHTAASLDSQ